MAPSTPPSRTASASPAAEMRRREDVDRAAATAIVPALLTRLACTSVVHVGCGTGAWLAACLDAGLDDVLGLDDGSLPREASCVPRALLRREPAAARRFDLVLCTDAALTPSVRVDARADQLARRGDVLLLATAARARAKTTAAWDRSLARHGFAAVGDADGTWRDVPAVAPWLRRGLRLYATAAARDRLRLDVEPVPCDRAAPPASDEASWAPPTPPPCALGAAPSVAVVIPCHNYARFLPDAVGSVAGQTWRHLQCVVVDDGSTDDTAAVTATLMAQHPTLDLRLVRQANTGVGCARNAGVRATTSPLVMQLDADDRLTPNAVASLVGAFAAEPAIDVAYCDAEEFGAATRPMLAASRVSLSSLRRDNRLNYCALVRRTAFVHVGGYRDIRSGFDDWDLWLSLAAAGFRFRHVAERLLLYRRHGASLMDRESTRMLALRAQVVLNHPDTFGLRQLRWAEAVLRRDAAGAPRLSALALAWYLLRDRRPARALRALLGGASASTPSTPSPTG